MFIIFLVVSVCAIQAHGGERSKKVKVNWFAVMADNFHFSLTHVILNSKCSFCHVNKTGSKSPPIAKTATFFFTPLQLNFALPPVAVAGTCFVVVVVAPFLHPKTSHRSKFWAVSHMKAEINVKSSPYPKHVHTRPLGCTANTFSTPNAAKQAKATMVVSRYPTSSQL